MGAYQVLKEYHHSSYLYLIMQYHFLVWRPGIEPRSPGPLANTLLIRLVIWPVDGGLSDLEGVSSFSLSLQVDSCHHMQFSVIPRTHCFGRGSYPPAVIVYWTLSYPPAVIVYWTLPRELSRDHPFIIFFNPNDEHLWSNIKQITLKRIKSKQ